MAVELWQPREKKIKTKTKSVNKSQHVHGVCFGMIRKKKKLYKDFHNEHWGSLDGVNMTEIFAKMHMHFVPIPLTRSKRYFSCVRMLTLSCCLSC